MVKWSMPASRNQWSRGNCCIVIPWYFYLNPVPIVVKVLTWTNLTRTERFQNSLCTACLSPCKDRHPTHSTRVPIGTKHISYCKVSLNSNVMPSLFSLQVYGWKTFVNNVWRWLKNFKRPLVVVLLSWFWSTIWSFRGWPLCVQKHEMPIMGTSRLWQKIWWMFS